ncbi:hypothetical protein PGT21_010989 [Puccinia graminis f. sp. tritici]|uniref:TNFR-Cys domain-containing protein n=1 Tax=Puccinia graminis f. sp. tritici TaxID=56615 RepID=A0A5B0SL47_PUCGR|nr:hypothetical protein PGT21_010989 [Puccinia graminis f. sp. tritici]KAA1138658.1 hypothetical protein PGTUg99_033368 [Puccinia graminis f. sp. tritici]
MQIWKGTILCLMALLCGLAFAANLEHTASCPNPQTMWRTAGNLVACPKAGCQERYRERAEAHCPNCAAPTIIEVFNRGCDEHQDEYTTMNRAFRLYFRRKSFKLA